MKGYLLNKQKGKYKACEFDGSVKRVKVPRHSTIGMNATAKARALSDLMKTELPIAVGICVVAGEILALGGFPTVVAAFTGFLTGFFISGSAMISNDYFDLDVDRINHPERPLPSGRITIFELTALTCLFSAGGFAAAAFLGTLPLTLSVIIWAIGILYNWKYKEAGLTGNMMVSSSVAMIFIFGGVAVGGLTNGVVWAFGALHSYSTSARRLREAQWT
jgi:geranylgeranylglycerol-phosphate geranylgeranyltransferase